eukprot:5115138-Lingulodinium_polyedra.AAC.1
MQNVTQHTGLGPNLGQIPQHTKLDVTAGYARQDLAATGGLPRRLVGSISDGDREKRNLVEHGT